MKTHENSYIEAAVLPCRCKSRYCPTCAPSMGFKLRARLMERVQSFKAVQMWTLTIDQGALGWDSETTFDYCKRARVVARFVSLLHARGYLNSRAFFCAIEFQGNGNVHFHVLVDTYFVPFAAACDAWNDQAPAGFIARRTGFGSVKVSYRRGSVEGAARYVTKYLTKCGDVPNWVLNRSSHVHRYTVSKGFWGNVAESSHVLDLPCKEISDQMRADKHSAECYCDRCRTKPESSKAERYRRTNKQIIDSCGHSAVVMIRETFAIGDEVHNKYSVVDTLPACVASEFYGFGWCENVGELISAVSKSWRNFCQLFDSERGKEIREEGYAVFRGSTVGSVSYSYLDAS